MYVIEMYVIEMHFTLFTRKTSQDKSLKYMPNHSNTCQITQIHAKSLKYMPYVPLSLSHTLIHTDTDTDRHRQTQADTHAHRHTDTRHDPFM